MSEHNPSPNERRLAAEREVEDLKTRLHTARVRPGILTNELRKIDVARDGTGDKAHEQIESLRGSAGAPRFQAACREYVLRELPERKRIRAETTPPPPELVSLGLLAGFTVDEIYDALHEAVDALVADPAQADFSAAKSSDLDAAVEAKRREIREAESAATAMSDELRRAEIRLDQATALAAAEAREGAEGQVA